MKSTCAEIGGQWHQWLAAAAVVVGTLAGAGCTNSNRCPTCVNFGPPVPAAKVVPTSLMFGNQAETTTSAAQPVALSNTGSAPLVITSITASGDFAETDNCPAELAIQQGCTIDVTFSPKALGARTGQLTIVDNDPHGSQIVMLSGTGTAAPPPAAIAARLYVASLASNEVTVIDRNDWHVIAKVAVGKNPAGLALLPNGTKLYVSNFGDGTVSVVDTASARVVVTIRVGENPSGIVAGADGADVWVVNSGSNTLERIDTRSDAVVSSVRTGAKPRGIAVTPDGAWVYVTNAGDQSVSKISTATNEVAATIAVDKTPMSAAVTPDGNYVYVTNAGAASVTVIDTAKDHPVATLAVGTNPVAVLMSHDGNEALVVNENFLRGAGSVTVLDTRRMAPLRTLTAGGNPLGAVISADDATIYVVNLQDGTVMEVDTRRGDVHATHTVGMSPAAVAVAPEP